MKTKWIIISLVVLLTLSACPQWINFDAETADNSGDQVVTVDSEYSEDSPFVGETGEIRLQVPLISSYLAEAMGIAYTDPVPTSRSVLIISKVDFYIFDSGATLVDSWTYDTPVGPDTYHGEEPLDSRTVPSADGYTIQADIYNSLVSPDDPILSGTSEAFSVTSGNTTEITIRPIPITPTPVATADVPVALPDASFTSTFWDGVTEQVVNYGDDGIEGTADDIYGPVYTWGKEHWFEINASSNDVIRITATPDASSGVVMMIADSDGDTMTMAMSGNANPQGGSWVVGEDATLAILSPDDAYYVGMITVNDGTSATNSTVDLSFTAAADDANEPNNSTLFATDISKGTIMSGIDLDPVEHSWTNTGGDLFTFDVTAEEDPANIEIAIVFDHDQGDLCLWLYDDTGNELAYSNDSESGTGQEIITIPDDYASLSVGSTYYILVGTDNNWPVGNTYQLQWVSGEGTIDIGIQ